MTDDPRLTCPHRGDEPCTICKELAACKEFLREVAGNVRVAAKQSRNAKLQHVYLTYADAYHITKTVNRLAK